jgi:heterotetrameric sarcosine oxidase gamma subunit
VKHDFNIALPNGAKWTARNGVAFLGTGPGKWLAISEAPDPTFVKKLETRLQGNASVIEQSGGLGVLRLTGSALLGTLAKGVQIDLAPGIFPPGSVAVTSIAHIGATLWSVDDGPTIDIAVARSLADSFQHWLEVSAAIHGLSVRRTPG